MQKGLFTRVPAPGIYANVPNIFAEYVGEDYKHFSDQGIMQDFSNVVKTEEEAPIEIRGENSFAKRFGQLSV